jgi:hypothetical protein
MASAFPDGGIQSGGWAHRFWKKARRFAAGKSSRASRGDTDNADSANQAAEGNTSPQRRHQMKLSDYQKQMHEEGQQKKTRQLRHPPKED